MEEKKVAEETKEEVVKEKQEEKKTVEADKEEKTKKSKKVPIIIAIVVAVILILAAVGGYFGYKYYQENKSTGSTWGDTYYAYLKSAVAEDSNKEDYGLKGGMENIELQFIEVGEEDPVMAMTYEYEQKPYVTLIYTTNEGTNVNKVEYLEQSTIMFLYDIQYDAYSWYMHTESDTADSYQKIYTILENPVQNSVAEYTITKGEQTTQEKLSGETITLSKFDETFVNPGIEVAKFDFSEDIQLQDLNNNISQAVSDYKTTNDLVTEEVKTETTTKVAEVNQTKQSMEDAKAEIKADEEKKAAEELAKGLQVGSYRLKYGTYKTDAAQMDSTAYGTLTIKPNGVFHIKSNCDISTTSGWKAIDCDGTYVVGKVENSGATFDGLKFTTSEGDKFSFEVHSNTSGETYLSDQWHGYDYTGE